MTTHEQTEHQRPMRMVATVTAVLLILLAITVGLSTLNLGYLALPVALTIAAVKGAAIANWFMDLRHSPASVRFAAAAGLLWFLFLIVGVLTDQGTRGEHLRADIKKPTASR